MLIIKRIRAIYFFIQHNIIAIVITDIYIYQCINIIMNKKVVGIFMIAIFVMISFAPALSYGLPANNQIQLQESPIISTTHSDLIIKTKNISSNFFGSVNSIDIEYFNVTQTYYYNYHGLQYYTTCNVLGKVTGNTGGCTIITHQFSYVMTASNSTGTFKEYNGYVVMKNTGFSWYGSYTHNYVAMSAYLEIYNNGDVFMQYSMAYSQERSKNYVTFMDITNLIKHIDYC